LIIDPIDGTENCANGHPFAGASLGFVGMGKEVKFGIVAALLLASRYEASEGKGPGRSGDDCRQAQ
jgi:fructose-1,6-bisphosphatase/inositol monophosphatase family enzyme